MKNQELAELTFDISKEEVSDRFSKIKGKRLLDSTVPYQREFELMNTGNAPVLIESLTLDGRGCHNHGITIHNCNRSFELLQGETIEINFSYIPDYTRTKESLQLWITTESEIYTISVNVYFPLEEMSSFIMMMTMDKNSPEYQIAEFVIIIILSSSVAFMWLILYEAKKNKDYRRKLLRQTYETTSSRALPFPWHRILQKHPTKYAGPKFAREEDVPILEPEEVFAPPPAPINISF